MAKWNFLTNHACALVCIARDPGVRLRDIADALGITERSAYAIVNDLADDGYIVKEKDGRRNRYHIQADLPLRESVVRRRTIGEVLDLLVEAGVPRRHVASAYEWSSCAPEGLPAADKESSPTAPDRLDVVAKA